MQMVWNQTMRKLQPSWSWYSPFVGRNTNWTDPIAWLKYLFDLTKEVNAWDLFVKRSILFLLLISVFLFKL
uniref:Macaca fascicularis brain cDNA clone: QflA-22668, similar to human solute carrier family 19, member 3 (SLC19A3), mRNA, RefSeq: NM_025243.2 n=1 Tax=Macaca fascicularis TaxID=9541 RepID=I7GDJ2_MACFA|nr:unnamed protein product [Macaca fascicularis]